MRRAMADAHAFPPSGVDQMIDNREGDAMFGCDLCDRDFERQMGLSIHKARAHGVGKGRAKRRPKAETNGHDPELETMGEIVRLVETLSPTGKQWLAERLQST